VKLLAVILAGGRGERFWPVSKAGFPKQFLSLFDKKPMIMLTRQRLLGLVDRKDQYFVVPQDLLATARRVLKGGRFIVEPTGRNTAAAIGLAAMSLERRWADAVMCVLPSDHLIMDKPGFHRCLRFAARLAEQDYLVTFGIKPLRPETGYGYVKCRGRLETRGALVAYSVDVFKEKPDRATAARYLRSGDYYWNSGIFVWKVSTIVDAIRRHAPKLYNGLRAYLKKRQSALFARLPSISIDHQVMEKARRIALVRAAFDWDDVGSWDALARHCRLSPQGNVVLGRAISIDTKNSIVFSENRLIAVVGLEDTIVVDGGDAILVCKKGHTGRIREVVKQAGKT